MGADRIRHSFACEARRKAYAEALQLPHPQERRIPALAEGPCRSLYLRTYGLQLRPHREPPHLRIRGCAPAGARVPRLAGETRDETPPRGRKNPPRGGAGGGRGG